MEQQSEEERVTMPEAAMRLRRSWHQTWRLALTGQIEATKEGGAWRVSRASLDKFIARQSIAPQAA